MTSERTARATIFIFAAVIATIAAVGCQSDPEPAAADKAIEAAVEDPWLDALGSEDGGGAAAALPAAQPTTDDQPAATDQPATTDPPTTDDPLAGANPADANPSAGGSAPSALGSDGVAGGDRPGPAASDAPAPSAGPADSDGPPADAPSEAADSSPTEPTPSEATAAPEPAPAPEPAAPAPITLADFAGSYRYVGGSSQRQQLEQAIEDAAQSLPGIIRGIGRKRLTKTNQLDTSIDIVVTGDKINPTYTSGFSPSGTVGGGQVTWTSKSGDKYRVRFQLKGSKLIQVSASDDGVKTTVFVLSDDRSRLTVHHKVTSDRLPEAMTYRLSYARQ